MIVFDFLTGELKIVPPAEQIIDASQALLDFGTRSLGDVTIDTGYRLNEGSIIDFEFRV